ncbi:platelet glycoprotein Ib alpha chain-like [Branchiostoma floridae]|uniref:Platelet glycoprotein Ib alpha chain-like n=1 Tax=Branchiostoma floridae TaxID=7739 RepID=A0A9J7LGR7_BRAFL|nr:platelet glycoprotein Ib alpha chain-like [Branchiostoma floridae]
MTASAVAGLPPLRLTVLVLWTTFGAVQQTACMPVQTPPSPIHEDEMVPPGYPNTQPTTLDSTTKIPEVDQDPATTMPPSSEVKLGTTSASAGTSTPGRLPATTQTIPGSTTQDGVYSTSTRQTIALLSTTGTDEVKVTTEATERPKNATTPVTTPPKSMEDLTTSEQGMSYDYCTCSMYLITGKL